VFWAFSPSLFLFKRAPHAILLPLGHLASSQFHANKWYFHIIFSLIVTANLEDDVLGMCRDWLLGNRLNKLGDPILLSVLCFQPLATLYRYSPHLGPLLSFLWREEAGIEQGHSTAQHGNFQSHCRKPAEDILESEVPFKVKSIPQLIYSLLNLATALVESKVLALGASNGFTEGDKWKSEVDESIAVILKFVLAIDNLVELEANKSGNQSGSLFGPS